MALEVVATPTLLDFIRVVLNMAPDQREHFSAMTGHPYDVDGIAVGNFMVQGPKWCFRSNSVPIAVGGFAPQRPGVYRDFFISTPEAFSAHGFAVTRLCRRIMDSLLEGGAHRLECIVPASRVQGYTKLEKWYAALGYKEEARHERYCADGTDAICYSRVRP